MPRTLSTKLVQASKASSTLLKQIERLRCDFVTLWPLIHLESVKVEHVLLLLVSKLVHKLAWMDAPAPERDAQAAASTSAAEQPAAGFARRKNRGNIRKRPAEDAAPAVAVDNAADGDADVTAVAARRAKVARDAPLVFSTRREGDGDAGGGPRLEAFKYESARTLQQASDMGATHGNQQETSFDQDAR